MRRDTVISCENVSKDFELCHNPQNSLKQRFVGIFNARYRARKHLFRALDEVSLNVSRGEAVGLVGQNGSGKSTLLTLIAGIYPATSGRLQVRGRVIPMISLGVGFHPELTGIENIYLNASLFGVRNEDTARMIPDILDFAELGEFIEEPVKTYSSGMHARLGFAVAVHLQPEILLADEILSVGDAEFQTKCLSRIEQMRRQGMTLLFVSHSTQQVARFCDRYLRLDRGKVVAEGPTQELLETPKRAVKAQRSA